MCIFLAQCLISILLRKPDFARSRPSTLLTDDETYSKLYSEKYSLEVYYKVGKIGKMIQNYLRKLPNWTTAEKSDILFYLLYALCAKILNKTNIGIQDVINLDISVFTEQKINEINELIYNKYKELGGNGRVAKSSTFVDEIDILLGL